MFRASPLRRREPRIDCVLRQARAVADTNATSSSAAKREGRGVALATRGSTRASDLRAAVAPRSPNPSSSPTLRPRARRVHPRGEPRRGVRAGLRGTLFLDEIGERRPPCRQTPARPQSALSSFRRHAHIEFNILSCPPRTRLDRRSSRANSVDLFFRLTSCREPDSLRYRREESPAAAAHFAAKAAEKPAARPPTEPALIEVLQEYDGPATSRAREPRRLLVYSRATRARRRVPPQKISTAPRAAAPPRFPSTGGRYDARRRDARYSANASCRSANPKRHLTAAAATAISRSPPKLITDLVILEY